MEHIFCMWKVSDSSQDIGEFLKPGELLLVSVDSTKLEGSMV